MFSGFIFLSSFYFLTFILNSFCYVSFILLYLVICLGFYFCFFVLYVHFLLFLSSPFLFLSILFSLGFWICTLSEVGGCSTGIHSLLSHHTFRNFTNFVTQGYYFNERLSSRKQIFASFFQETKINMYF